MHQMYSNGTCGTGTSRVAGSPEYPSPPGRRGDPQPRQLQQQPKPNRTSLVLMRRGAVAGAVSAQEAQSQAVEGGGLWMPQATSERRLGCQPESRSHRSHPQLIECHLVGMLLGFGKPRRSNPWSSSQGAVPVEGSKRRPRCNGSRQRLRPWPGSPRALQEGGQGRRHDCFDSAASLPHREGALVIITSTGIYPEAVCALCTARPTPPPPSSSESAAAIVVRVRRVRHHS